MYLTCFVFVYFAFISIYFVSVLFSYRYFRFCFRTARLCYYWVSAFDWLNSMRQLTLLVPSCHQGDESLWVLCFPLSESMGLWQRGWKRNNCASIIHYSFLLFFPWLIHYSLNIFRDVPYSLFVQLLFRFSWTTLGAMPLHEKGDIHWDRLQSLKWLHIV